MAQNAQRASYVATPGQAYCARHPVPYGIVSLSGVRPSEISIHAETYSPQRHSYASPTIEPVFTGIPTSPSHDTAYDSTLSPQSDLFPTPYRSSQIYACSGTPVSSTHSDRGAFSEVRMSTDMGYPSPVPGTAAEAFSRVAPTSLQRTRYSAFPAEGTTYTHNDISGYGVYPGRARPFRGLSELSASQTTSHLGSLHETFQGHFGISAMPDISEPSGTPVGAPAVCLWDGCGMPLDDVTVGGIRRHLRAFHFHEAAEPYKGKRGACLWACGAGNHSCNRELDYASFGKHIASVHIRSTARRCGYCAAMIGRIDSLHRHMREHCPKRPTGMDNCPEDR